jgi:hypothetical protein
MLIKNNSITLMIGLMNCFFSLSSGAMYYLRNLSPLLLARFEAMQGKHMLVFLAHESPTGVADDHCRWISGKRPSGWRRFLWDRCSLHAHRKSSPAHAFDLRTFAEQV